MNQNFSKLSKSLESNRGVNLDSDSQEEDSDCDSEDSEVQDSENRVQLDQPISDSGSDQDDAVEGEEEDKQGGGKQSLQTSKPPRGDKVPPAPNPQNTTTTSTPKSSLFAKKRAEIVIPKDTAENLDEDLAIILTDKF